MKKLHYRYLNDICVMCMCLLDMHELAQYLTKNHPVSTKTSPNSSMSVRRASESVDNTATKPSEFKGLLARPFAKTQSDSNQSTQKVIPVGGGKAGSGDCEDGTNDKWPWKCKRCGFIHQNVSRVKRHIVCYHMKLKPFRCPYCSVYIWKMQVY